MVVDCGASACNACNVLTTNVIVTFFIYRWRLEIRFDEFKLQNLKKCYNYLFIKQYYMLEIFCFSCTFTFTFVYVYMY